MTFAEYVPFNRALIEVIDHSKSEEARVKDVLSKLNTKLSKAKE